MKHHMKKLISRKLVVWLVATALLAYGILPPEYWMGISTVYLGVQSVLDHQTAKHNDPLEA